MLFNRWQHVCKDRGASWPRHREQVWEFRDGQTQICLRAFDPFIDQLFPLQSPDVYSQKGSGHRIKAGGKDDSVEFKLFTTGP